MAEDHDAGVGNGADLVRNGDTAFEFDGIHAAFLDKAHRIVYRVLTAGVIGTEGHIANQIGVGCAPADTLTVRNGHVHRHRHGPVIAVDDHAHGIADQDHVHPDLFREGGET